MDSAWCEGAGPDPAASSGRAHFVHSGGYPATAFVPHSPLTLEG